MQVFRDLSLTGRHRAAQEPQAWPWGGLECGQAGLDGLEGLTEEIRLSWVRGMVPPNPGGTNGKELPANAGDVRDGGPIPGLGRSPGGGHGDPLQCSCVENPMDRGAWWSTIHRVAKRRT